ncbi:MAG: HD family phosphohydrolase [Pirellulaceae bacterium]
MASSSSKRTRSERVASLKLEPSSLHRWFRSLLTGKGLVHFALGLLSAALLIIFLRGWQAPFPYREGQIPQRDIIARIGFEMNDATKTEADREQARRQSLCVYDNEPEQVLQLTRTVREFFTILRSDDDAAELSEEQTAALNALLRAQPEEGGVSDQDALKGIREIVAEHGNLDGGKLDLAIRSVLDQIANTGVLTTLEHDVDQGDQRSILVDGAFVDVAKVRRAELVASLPQRITDSFLQVFESSDVTPVAKVVGKFLAENLPEKTLAYNSVESEENRRRAEDGVPDAITTYSTSSRLAEKGEPLTREVGIPILQKEHRTWLAARTWTETTLRLLAFCGMLVALYLLCGWFIYSHYLPELLSETPQLTRLLATVVTTCILCSYLAVDPVRAEIVPLILCAMTLAVAFGKQVALLTTICLGLVISLGLGLDIGGFVTMSSGICAAALLVGRIRTRTKLIYVGLTAGLVVALTNLGVAVVLDKAQASLALPEELLLDSGSWVALIPNLLSESLRYGGYTLLAAATMTGILPFIERAFGIQTDLSLLELGDASHQLLRQLAQRAPGTYNHSINVAAIAEAAADAIGGHGLLTRVGAYFHDIGKMFKPNYFIENQEQGGNRHDQLQPAMSTLVIIAHVKDGADLARQHRLPKPIIDFIEQHHGTTLVEYFFREAEKRSQDDPNKEEVSETSFRYPGPKPQSLEAAVLMLADSVESASRTLVEPTPSRIQNLVDDIAMKKLLDGQFDQCGLTLQQLDQLKSSLVKSLTAIYHGRVKYTGQASA